MSSLTLRQAIEADWPRLCPTLRFVQTENRELPRKPALPLPDVWGTIFYEVERRAHLTMGTNPWIEEAGTATIVLVTRAGHGTVPVISMGDAVMRAWEGWADPTGNVWFVNVGPPRALESEPEGEWTLYGIPCAYRVQERVALP